MWKTIGKGLNSTSVCIHKRWLPAKKENSQKKASFLKIASLEALNMFSNYQLIQAEEDYEAVLKKNEYCTFYTNKGNRFLNRIQKRWDNKIFCDWFEAEELVLLF